MPHMLFSEGTHKQRGWNWMNNSTGIYTNNTFHLYESFLLVHRSCRLMFNQTKILFFQYQTRIFKTSGGSCSAGNMQEEPYTWGSLAPSSSVPLVCKIIISFLTADTFPVKTFWTIHIWPFYHLVPLYFHWFANTLEILGCWHTAPDLLLRRK